MSWVHSHPRQESDPPAEIGVLTTAITRLLRIDLQEGAPGFWGFFGGIEV
jgi:hypothetical protein